MKNKALLVATMALPLAFAACVQDEFESNSMSQAQEGELITLPENYLLAGMFGGAAETRSIYHNGTEFAWLPVNKVPDAIGLCWRGGGYTSNPNVVYTNYKFEHFGWLGKGETAPVLNCDGELENGQQLEALGDNDENKADLLAGTWGVAGTDGKYANMMVDAKNGLFHTENSTIFKGDYIVYYPYNEQFHDVDYIPATAPTMIKRTGSYCLDESTQKYTEELAKEVFVAGTMTGVDGGQQNGVFSTNFVSGAVIVRIKATKACEIRKVLLVAENGFATEVKLDAQKIASGAKGAALYAAEPTKFENALIAEINGDGTNGGMQIREGKTANVVFPVLPTTSKTALKNAQVILVAGSGKTLVRPAADLVNLVSLAEEWNLVEMSIKPEDFAFNAYAYDTESLLKALTEHNVANKKGQTINVLTKITLDPEYKFTMPYPTSTVQKETALKDLFHETSASLYIAEDLTLTGKGEIVVPADVQLTFKSVNGENKPTTVTFDVPVTIEGKGCCGKYPGTVVLRTKSGKQGSYVFNKKITNEGTLYLGTDLNGAVDIKAVEIDNNGGYINAYCAGKNLEDKGSTISIDKLTNTYVARDTETEEEKVNNGRVNIVAKFWNQATGEKENAAKGSKNRVNMTVGELINNENAYVLVGKRTNLYVTGASKNNGRIKVETSGEGTNINGVQETDGKLQIEETGSIENAGLVENYGVVNTLGSMTQNSDDAVIIEYVGSQFGFNNPRVDAGEYICEVEDVDGAQNGDRLAAAIDPNMPTTTVRFVGDGTGFSDNEYLYELASYGSLLKDKKVVVATIGKPVKFTSEKDGEVVPVTIGKTLNVEKGSELQLANIRLTVNGNVTVDGTMTIDKYGADDDNVLNEKSAFATGSGTNVVVNGAYEVKSYVRTSLGGDMTINEGAKAVFNYASYTDIEDLIYIDGTFVRILSSGGQTSNSATVYCGRFEKGKNGHIVNGGPQSPSN